MSCQNLEIAIIGGGPGGLTLARILQQKGIKSVTVYEQEESRFVRGQGGSLDLHPKTGQFALKEAGLMEEFNKHCRPEGQDMRILDKNGVVHFEQTSPPNQNERPEIDRSKLRDILLDSLPEETIHWGHALKSLEQLDGKIRLLFTNGKTALADLVVGADGAWSKVRPYLSPDVQPIYTGISFIEINLSEADKFPEICSLVGRGSMFAADEDQVMIAQRNGNGIIRTYVGLRVPEDWISKLDFSDIDKAKQFTLNLYKQWDKKFWPLITNENAGDFTTRRIHALPVGHSWTRNSVESGQISDKLTLLGDAAHLMSPFAGEGVNLAMIDAARLASALTSKLSLQNALIRYEKEMFTRGQAAAQQSADNLVLFFGPDGAIRMADLFKQMSSWLFPVNYLFNQFIQRITSKFW